VTAERKLALWLAVGVGSVLLLWLLRSVLTPFIAGMAVAYFLDPLADRLEERGISRTLATLLILAAFFVAAVALLVVLVPVLHAQVAGFVSRLPGYVDSARGAIEPLLARLQAELTPEQVEEVRSAVGASAGDAVKWLGRALGGIVSGGVAIFNAVSLIVITPLVAFYLLRDWDRIVAWIDGLLPMDAAETIREQMHEVDTRLAGFVRGQSTVCLILGAAYAAGLTVIGLDFGLLVGLGAGLISFIPYLGTAISFCVGIGIAVAQFSDWMPIVLVAAVFIAGQVLEGFVLTPNLVGDRVGLHPAWVLFALMAGGALFGFVGVLLALPAAAVIGVGVRFTIARYRTSALYGGAGDGDGAGAGGGGP